MTSPRQAPAVESCGYCGDDGYIEHWDHDGGQIVGVVECPHLHEPWHRPFNATGILGPVRVESEAG